jgi:hypothetical protein
VRDFLVLGGAGLVGLQVCRRIATELSPQRIIVASLLAHEAAEAIARLGREFPHLQLESAHGDLFVPAELATRPRAELMRDPPVRKRLLEFLYGDFDKAYADNHLVQLIGRTRPDVIVDCVNTATGLSYQDVFQGAQRVLGWLGDGYNPQGVEDLEQFLLSQSVPQLVRHVRFLHRATSENQTRVYLKVGTTGTGGMGLNIPYTHSEDKPSSVLLAKTEAAFGHTGLLFLLARTPHAPIVKEVKPAAMIGYKGVRTVPVKDKHGNSAVFEPRSVQLAGALSLREPAAEYTKTGELVLTVVDTGENGMFTRGEFAAITALGQMEYVTPEEIAHIVVQEIRGANTGRDVISAVDSSVMDPSYKAGLVRQAALYDLVQAEGHTALPSVALGRLGPPELSKLLFEAQLLKECHSTLERLVEEPVDALAAALAARIGSSAVRAMAPSIGIPILLPDGRTLLRGPSINVPELRGHDSSVSLDDPTQVDQWAARGWIDLRPANVETWLKRVQKMVATRTELRDAGSAAASISTYLPSAFEIGEVVAWIFNNEIGGYRIK